MFKISLTPRLTGPLLVRNIIEGLRERIAGKVHTEGLTLAITSECIPGKGWIAFAPEVRATAQGETEDEAKSNLVELLHAYPDLLDEARVAAARRVNLITV